MNKNALIDEGKVVDKYIKYEEGELKNFIAFDLLVGEPASLQSPVDPPYGNITYDINSNTYNCKIVKHYKIDKPQNNKLKYVIGVRADNDYQKYLSGLSNKGVIDVNLLGSDTVELSGWRFINNYDNNYNCNNYNYY